MCVINYAIPEYSYIYQYHKQKKEE